MPSVADLSYLLFPPPSSSLWNFPPKKMQVGSWTKCYHMLQWGGELPPDGFNVDRRDSVGRRMKLGWFWLIHFSTLQNPMFHGILFRRLPQPLASTIWWLGGGGRGPGRNASSLYYSALEANHVHRSVLAWFQSNLILNSKSNLFGS